MKNLGEREIGYLEMIAAMLLMGTVGLFVVESGQSAHNVVFFRCVFGTIFLALYCYARGFFRNTGLTRRILFLATLSGVFLVSNWVLLFASFKTASISTSTVIYHTQPFFFVLIGAAVFRESVSFNKFVWIIFAFVGVVFVADIDPDSFSLSPDHLAGVVYALTAAMLWAIAAMIVKQLKGIKPHLVALIQVFVGIFVLFPFAKIDAVAGATQVQWGYLVILGAVHTCLTYILMYSAFQRLQTAVIAVLTFIYPAVAIFVDFFFYGVVLAPLQMLGVLLILFSSFAVSQNLQLLSRRRASQ
jgi:drug/metabolite transporter (DMT)-like permease